MTPIANSLWVGVVVTVAVPVGFFACALICLLMGVANMPGHYLWRSGAASGNGLLRFVGAILSWLGQSYVSLTFAVVLICLVRLFFAGFVVAGLIQFVVWAEALFLAVGPACYSCSAAGSERRAGEGEGCAYETLGVTFIVTLAGYFAFVFYPKAALYGWGWLPFVSHVFPTPSA